MLTRTADLRPLAVHDLVIGRREESAGVIDKRPQSPVRSLSATTKDPGLGPPIDASTLAGRHPERGARACQPVVSVLVSLIHSRPQPFTGPALRRT